MSLIRRMFGRAHKTAAVDARQAAEQSLVQAKRRTAEIRTLADRIDRHAVINHIGERVEAAWRGM